MTSILKAAPGYRALAFARQALAWRARGYAAPSPQGVKESVLLRHAVPDSVWVETGTYEGTTTAVLARSSKRVFSIEPDAALHAKAQARFRDWPNVEVLRGLSEGVLPELLPRIEGSVQFWLDGHYSAGPTHKGPKDTPIVEELATIERHLGRWGDVAVLVDDVRCFVESDGVGSSYPPLDVLVDWSRRNWMRWHIEHDIFVAVK